MSSWVDIKGKFSHKLKQLTLGNLTRKQKIIQLEHIVCVITTPKGSKFTGKKQNSNEAEKLINFFPTPNKQLPFQLQSVV